MFLTNFWKNRVDVVVARHLRTEDKIKAIEEYLDIEYFNGDKYKPHYRKRKTVKRPVGRPRKK
jgi:hypothetical protein